MKYPHSTVKFVSLIIVLLLGIYNSTTTNAQVAQRFGILEDIEAFDINEAEDFMVIAKMVNGKSKLFEVNKVVFGWTEPSEISSINDFEGGMATIGGPFLSDDGKRLYYHANFSDTKGGLDIYYSVKTKNGWSNPINMGQPINTLANQYCPSITPGQDRIYYAQDYGFDYEYNKPKLSPGCQKIITAIKQPNLTWGEPYAVHQVINNGCGYSPLIAIDGKTLFYSCIDAENHKDGFKICYAKEKWLEVWEMPSFIEINEDIEGDKLNPRIANGTLYFLRCFKEKKEIKKQIYFKPLVKKAHPSPMISSSGKVLNKVSKQAIEADLTIFNPTTLKVLGKYQSDKNTGAFKLCLSDRQNYLIEVRKEGYSFASYLIDYRKDEKIHIPELIELFDTIELSLSVFDSEIFSPLKVEATASNASHKNKVYEGVMVEEGVYSFKLPLGSNYQISAFADWFDQNEFLFKLEGDIVFNKFNRNLPLRAQKNIFSILTSDSETGAVFVAEGFFVNLSSDEPPIFFSADDVDENGNVKISLRKGDQYELTMNKEGYFFHSQIIDLQKDNSDSLSNIASSNDSVFSLAVKMDSLRTDKAITLDNIIFAHNSAALDTSAFDELDKVVYVIKENPSIIIEISAHTDNIGSARYNNILSDKRAQSVVNYLIENEVPLEQVISKGYGFTQPKVPNDSDENRTLNRRVEFKVVKKDDQADLN